MLDDGINAFSTEFQQNEFFRNQPVDIQECFEAYGVENYVDPVSYTHLDVYKRQNLVCASDTPCILSEHGYSERNFTGFGNLHQ